MSIAYKLHLDMGRAINMYDWFLAFRSVWPRHGQDERELHARFIQATSELQLLGFIKPFGRKPDHVAKATFSFS